MDDDYKGKVIYFLPIVGIYVNKELATFIHFCVPIYLHIYSIGYVIKINAML